MEKIEGIDLANLAKIVEEETVHEQSKKIRSVISGIYSDIATWEKDVIKKKNEISGLQTKIQKASDKLVKIRNNDWSVLDSKILEKNSENS